MTIADNIGRAEDHLRQIWETLLREGEQVLARGVEGVLAELIDERTDPGRRLEYAAREWRTLNTSPNGLPDWKIWRDDEEQRLSLNHEFERHFQILQELLG